MESWHKRLFLTRIIAPSLLLLSAVSSVSYAAELPAVGQRDPLLDPNIERRDITESAIDAENFEVGLYAGILSVEDFGVNAVTGVRFAYHVTEDLFFEANYGISEAGESSFERLSGGTPLLTSSEREIMYYNASIGFNILPGEAFISSKRAYNTAFYLTAGMGSTEFAGDTRFTLSFGTGYRILVNDWMAVHMGFRDHIFDIDVLGSDQTTNNLEMITSLTVFF